MVRVESEEWRLESGEWRVVSGERRAESGERTVESRQFISLFHQIFAKTKIIFCEKKNMDPKIR